MQKIFGEIHSVEKLSGILAEINATKVLVVCDGSFPFLSIKSDIEKIKVPHILFSDFTPNPLYSDVCKGVKLFNDNFCDVIIAIGGGSTIDVAKCIKLFCKMKQDKLFLEQPFTACDVPVVAIPTTAGTGSESTRYAVIYYEGKKQSITHESIVPEYVILDSSVLLTLPIYQKKCTMLDALCQGIESFWSVNSTEESKTYSLNALKLIVDNYKNYLNGDAASATQIMSAANSAGRAINITQTTAAHAMSYKLTSMYKLPHGHAVAVCLPQVWRFMLNNLSKCIDERGPKYLLNIFDEIASALNCASVQDAIEWFEKLLVELGIESPETTSVNDIEILAKSVNLVRLKNNPVVLSESTLSKMYENIVRIKK